MKILFMRLIALFLTLSLLFTGCTGASQVKKIKNRWNIPENEDIRVTLINGDCFEFQKDEFKVFNELQALKGLGVRSGSKDKKDISQVVIPLDDIQTVEIQDKRSYQYLLTAGMVGGIGVLVYFLLKK